MANGESTPLTQADLDRAVRAVITGTRTNPSQHCAFLRGPIAPLVAHSFGTLRRVDDAQLHFAVPDVRRRNIWHRWDRGLAESGLRLGLDVRRRACGEASGDVRWSFA